MCSYLLTIGIITIFPFNWATPRSHRNVQSGHTEYFKNNGKKMAYIFKSIGSLIPYLQLPKYILHRYLGLLPSEVRGTKVCSHQKEFSTTVAIPEYFTVLFNKIFNPFYSWLLCSAHNIRRWTRQSKDT